MSYLIKRSLYALLKLRTRLKRISNEKLRNHFEEEHGLDYTIEAVTQMITNRGHSLESIKK